MEEGNGALLDEVIDCTLMLYTMSSVFAHCSVYHEKSTLTKQKQ